MVSETKPAGDSPLGDVYAAIREADPATVRNLAANLALRASSPQQRGMLDTYLGDLTFPPGARVLEVGCGTGPVARVLAAHPAVAEVVGVDLSPIFLQMAREQSLGFKNISFREADGRTLPFLDATFDVVVFHTTLTHVLGPSQALAEAFRVLKSGGWLAVFDVDCVTVSFATGPFDPLQACADAATAQAVDPWLVRRLPATVRAAGFEVGRFRSYGHVEHAEGGHLLGMAERWADALVDTGRIGQELGTALKREARRRVEAGEFFGHIAYASLVARRP